MFGSPIDALLLLPDRLLIHLCLQALLPKAAGRQRSRLSVHRTAVLVVSKLDRPSQHWKLQILKDSHGNQSQPAYFLRVSLQD